MKSMGYSSAQRWGKWQTHGYTTNTLFLDAFWHLRKVDEKWLTVMYQDPSNSETENLQLYFVPTRCYTDALQIVIRAQKRRKERIVEAMKAYDTVNGAFNFNLMWERVYTRLNIIWSLKTYLWKFSNFVRDVWLIIYSCEASKTYLS